MNKKTKNYVIIGILVCCLLSACNFPLAKKKGEAIPTPLSDSEILGTAVAQTLSVYQSELANTETEATATPLPMVTQMVEATDSTGLKPTVQSYNAQACYAASISTETISDYTKMDRDEDFTKTWTIVNTGTCTWDKSTLLVFVNGDKMDGDSSEAIGTQVTPGGHITASVDLTAPSSNGTYTGKWALQTADGTYIVYMTVVIVVNEDDDDFYVSTVSFSSAETYSGVCPYTYTYKAYITTEGDGDVVYYFKYSDGSTSSSKTLEFEDGVTQTVSGSWTLSSSGSYWVKVYIDDPNNQTFGSAKLTLTCASPTKTATTVPTVTTEPTTEPTTAPTAEPTTDSSGEEPGEGETSG
jgi:hypothetical protein